MTMALAGCSGQGSDLPTPAGNTGPSGNTPTSAADRVTTQGTPLFSDTNADGVELQVVEFSDGTIGASLGAPLSVKLPVAASDRLEDLYHALRPEAAEVPESLTALSQRVEAMRASANVVAAPASADAILDKSQAAFNSAVSQTFTDGQSPPAGVYVPLQCVWQDTRRGGALINGATIRYYNHTYAWNNTPWATTLEWYNDTLRYSWGIHTFWMTWAVVYGSDPTVGFYGALWMNDDSQRIYNTAWDFGITRHQYSQL